MRRRKIILTVSVIVALLSGCSSKEPEPRKIKPRKDIHTKPYELKITPIIGTRQEDAKVIMDMGKIMKVWIAPYKNNGVFVSSHDNFVVAKKPDFVVGEEIPTKNWGSMHTPTNSIPFIFRDSDLDNSTKLEKEEIVKFNNNVYKEQNSPDVSKQRIQEASKYDKQIIDFLKD